jgi:hypothetical protein
VTGTHTYNEQSFNGSRITVTVTDAGGKSVTFTTSAAVADAPIAAVPVSLSYSAQEGQTSPTVLLAGFTDGNPLAPLSDYSATINWGDGTPVQAVPAGSTAFTQPGGTGSQINVSGQHTYADPAPGGGPYTVTVTLTDPEGQSATAATTRFTVTDAPLSPVGGQVTLRATAGQSATLFLGGFLDANSLAGPGDFPTANITIDWGDGTVENTTGSVTLIGSGVFQVNGTHTYAQALSGTSETIVVKVRDVDGQSVTLTARVVLDGLGTSTGPVAAAAATAVAPPAAAVADGPAGAAGDRAALRHAVSYAARSSYPSGPLRHLPLRRFRGQTTGSVSHHRPES